VRQAPFAASALSMQTRRAAVCANAAPCLPRAAPSAQMPRALQPCPAVLLGRLMRCACMQAGRACQARAPCVAGLAIWKHLPHA